MRANSLARINMLNSFGTPRADEYLGRFRDAFGHPAHAILFFDLCRGIELVYAIEEELGISIPDEKANEFETVRDALEYIRSQTKK